MHVHFVSPQYFSPTALLFSVFLELPKMFDKVIVSTHSVRMPFCSAKMQGVNEKVQAVQELAKHLGTGKRTW